MKIKIILLAVAAIVGFAIAQEVTETNAEAAKCKTECSTEKECATKCKAKCDSKEKNTAEAGVTHFNVLGMTCTGCSTKLTSALSAVKGVEVKKVCHKSGCVDVKLSDGATAEQVQETITQSGFKITLEKKG